MRVVCFGSINIDHVYNVDHLVHPGETLICDNYRTFNLRDPKRDRRFNSISGRAGVSLSGPANL